MFGESSGHVETGAIGNSLQLNVPGSDTQIPVWEGSKRRQP